MTDVDIRNTQPLVSYLPQNGPILITTRDRNAALKLVEQRDMITIGPMDKVDSLALLEKKLGQQNDRDSITKLATMLEFMPLAMVQAAAYISRRAPRCSIQQYMDSFQKSDHMKTSLLDFEGGQLRRDWEAKNSVIITWQISFDHIRQIRPSAAELLSLMSFFDRQGIPEALLRDRNGQENEQQNRKEKDDIKHVDDDSSEDDDSGVDEDDMFEEDISTLRDYLFITANGLDFEMHGLVQLATRKWLKVQGQQERWKQQFIRNLCAEFPEGSLRNRAACQALFPHARSAAVWKPENQVSLRDWAMIMYNAASYAYEVGDIPSAMDMSVKAMKARRKLFGQESEVTLSSVEMTGLASHLAGRWNEAEKLEVQVMEARKSKLGLDHPDTLNAMGNLVSMYSYQGRWKEAEELCVQVIETCKGKLGLDHPRTLNSMCNLAALHNNQGRWKEAEELGMQVLETSMRELGSDHRVTLTSMNNLAATYRSQGRWKEAEGLVAQVFVNYIVQFGLDHPNTLCSINNMTEIYCDQKQWKEAEELGRHVMEVCKSKLGQDHPQTLISMGNYAFILKRQRRDTEAISLLRDSVRLQQRVIGDNHPAFDVFATALAEWEAQQVENSSSAGNVAEEKISNEK